MKANTGNGRPASGRRGRLLRSGRRVVGATLLASSLIAITLPAQATADTVSDIENAQERCSKLYAEAEAANEALEGTQAKLDEIEGKIDKAQECVKDDKESLKAQMRKAYKSGGITGWEALVSSDSLEGLLDNIDYSVKIRTENETSVKQVMDATTEIRELRDEVAQLRDSQKEHKDEIDAKLSEANGYMEGLTKDLRKQLDVDNQDPSWDIPKEISAGTGEAWRDVVLTCAYANLGGTYIWGGEEFKAADCSGLSKWCYAQAGIEIPHYSEDQAPFCTKPMSEAVPGDVAWTPGHIGICIGGGRTIEAMSPGMGICYGSVDSFVSCGSPI